MLSILILILFVALRARAAEGTFQAKPDIASCPVQVQLLGKFKPAPHGVIKPLQNLRGHLHPVNSSYFITRIGTSTYAIPTRCIRVNTPAAPSHPVGKLAAPRAPVPVETAAADASNTHEVFAPGTRRLEFRFRFLFYQDRVQVTDPSGDFSVLSHVSVVCPGVAYQRPLTPKLNLAGEACAMLGFADAGGTVDFPTATVGYSYDHAFTMGLRITPSIEFPFSGRDFSLGLGLPLIVQAISWGPTAVGGTASGSGLRFPGAVITLQGRRDRYGFIADFGFVKKPTQASYSIGMSYQL